MIATAIATIIRNAAGIGRGVVPATEGTPVTEGLPRIVYTELDDQRNYTDDGQGGIRKARYQLDCFAQHMTTAKEILQLVETTLDGYAGTTEGTQIVRVYFDGGSFGKAQNTPGVNQGAARCTVDLLVDYRP